MFYVIKGYFEFERSSRAAEIIFERETGFIIIEEKTDQNQSPNPCLSSQVKMPTRNSVV